tara:strand:- start:391 stop:1836 length:1446 start_codon:yes stop_codon:yes gene_type:complete
MKRNKFNLKNLATTVVSLSCVFNLSAQSAEDDMAMMESMFMASVESGQMVQVGQACVDKMNNKGWQEISTNSKGEKQYYIVGVGTVSAPLQSSAFADSVQNASTKALLDAKTKFSALLNQEIVSEILVDAKSQYTEGKPPDLLQDPDQISQGKEYDDLSYLDKMKILVNQQLDKLIDNETKESFNEDVANDNKKAEELTKRLEDILNQEQMTDVIKTKTSADVRGMIVKYGHFSSNVEDGKRPEVCIVTKWSPGLLRMADAVATNDFKVLKNGKKKSPLKDQIPVNAVSEKDFKGYMKLLGSFGTFLMRDENGDLNVVSFAVEGMKSNTPQSEMNARSQAIIKANRQIVQFLNESVELNTKTSTTEALTEYKDGLQDYYFEENHESRQAASAQANISGIQTLATYKGMHFLNQKPLVGAVTYYNPSAAEGAQDAIQALSSDPQKTSSSNEGEAVTIDPNAREKSVEIDTGAGYDDDEDEDF